MPDSPPLPSSGDQPSARPQPARRGWGKLGSVLLMLAPIPLGLLLLNEDVYHQVFDVLRPTEPGYSTLLSLIAVTVGCGLLGGILLCDGLRKGMSAVIMGVIAGTTFIMIDCTMIVLWGCCAGVGPSR